MISRVAKESLLFANRRFENKFIKKAMTIVIKEMVVKTTVEAEKQPQVKALSPEETDRLKEEILREIEKNIAAEPKRKER